MGSSLRAAAVLAWHPRSRVFRSGAPPLRVLLKLYRRARPKKGETLALNRLRAAAATNTSQFASTVRPSWSRGALLCGSRTVGQICASTFSKSWECHPFLGLRPSQRKITLKTTIIVRDGQNRHVGPASSKSSGARLSLLLKDTAELHYRPGEPLNPFAFLLRGFVDEPPSQRSFASDAHALIVSHDGHTSRLLKR